MKRLIIAAVICVTSASTFAFGSRDHWTTSYEQGTDQYVITGTGNSQLYISCTTEDNMFVQYTDAAGRQLSSLDPGGKLYGVVDRDNLMAINDSASPLGAAQLKLFWKRLREGQQVTISSAGMLTGKFTLKDADKVLPEMAKSNCHTGL